MTYPGLGGQQQPPYNAPAGQATPVGIQPGVSGQIVARRVIIIGTGGELLIYSPTAAAGNLIFSIAAAAFTDGYGNSVLSGASSYVASQAVSMNFAAIQYYSGSSTSWALKGSLAADFAGDLFYNAHLISGP